MNTTLLYILMFFGAVLMAVLPFGMLMGLASTIGIAGTDFRIIAGYIAWALVLNFVISLGSFSVLQKSNCDEIKNFRQIAANSGISVLFQVGAFALIGIIPWFRNVIANLLPPDLDPAVKLAIVFAYYSAWANSFGFAIGGTLSSSCARAIGPENAAFEVPQEETAPALAPSDQFGAIPPE
jgi:hypothetical protein